MKRSNRRTAPLVVAIASTAAAAALSGCASAGTQRSGDAMSVLGPSASRTHAIPSRSVPAHVQDGAAATSAHGSARLGADEFYKITMTVHNRSDMTLDVTSAQLAYDNGKNGGNWTSRPVSQLVPGQSETVEAYSAAGGQGISLVYRAVENRAEVKMVAQDPTAGANNTKDTVAAAPLIVTPSISKGLNCSATFTVTGNW